MNGVTAMDENGEEIKSPIKRLGSTRKLILFNNIRLQLNEQLRCLDVRMESQVSLIQELQDFFRRRGEVELDYSKSLDKLAKSLQLRHKEQKQKREQWPMFSSFACWQQMINQTKAISKDHAALSEIYSTHLVARLQTVIEDVQRIYRKCREIGYETHEEILRVLQELHTTMKTYHSYQTECKGAETKLRTAENQKIKLQQTVPKEKLERSKKYRLIEKEVLKRKNKYTDARLKALKAKNEYQLCLEASNTTIHKYFVEDLSDLIDCMDLGFHSVVSRALLMHVTADQGRCRAVLEKSDNLSHIVHSMDSRADKQKFLEQHHGAFMIPKRLEFQGEEEEEIEPELLKALHQEMEARLKHLQQRVSNLRTESEEIWKTLETAEINLLDILNTKDYDCSGYFGDGTSVQAAKPEGLTVKSRADKQEIEEFYITKIREYVLGTSRIARLDSKAELLRNALAKDSVVHSDILVKSNVPKRKRIGRMNISGQPKLFGGSLEEYLEVTAEEIPLIMRSCIRVINLYGLHHQGIFRVSGSQVEISNFREGFERGDDPLADTTDASDINSIAGVLKLYLRELREPLFPIIYFDHFVQLAQLESKQEIVLGIRKFLQNLSRSVIIVIRYLFSFLNHLSEYSDENMMDAYNLAICFGPTLMPAPEDKDQVQYQNQVNELIKNMIVFYDELFPKDLTGTRYEKYISQEPFIDIDVGDSPTEPGTEDIDSEVYPSEDESDTLEATVQFDFNARSSRELSLRKGQSVVLRKQVSNDWWQGTINGIEGLVPDKYVSFKIKDEERERSVDILKSSSEESIKTQNTSSGNPPIPFATQQTSSVLADLSTHPKTTTTTTIIRTSATIQINDKADVGNNKTVQPLVDDFHYDTVDNVKAKYNYHDEPHSFENAMDFLEDFNHFQFENKKPSEPIYAEPSKNSTKNLHFEEYDGVILRKTPNPIELPATEKVNAFNRHSETLKKVCSDSESEGDKNHHSDTNLFKDSQCKVLYEEEVDSPTRKFHSKSFSMSENRVGTQTTNMFQQNRDLWEKRVELNSQQSLSTSRILSRNRIAPDLVMDLPLSISKEGPTHSSIDSIDNEAEDMTSAERFAAQTQSTLKKKERFLSDSQFEIKKEVKLDEKIVEKPKAAVKPQEIKTGTEIINSDKLDEVLFIQEEVIEANDSKISKSMKDLHKSPILRKNTQKFVSQFADLHLTGGSKCEASSSGIATSQQLASFKPQVKVKPNIFKKPMMPFSSPDMSRRSNP